jgi:hypothetical protein
MRKVFLNRPGADGKKRGNLRIRLPTRDPAQDLPLSARQPAQASAFGLHAGLLEKHPIEVRRAELFHRASRPAEKYAEWPIDAQTSQFNNRCAALSSPPAQRGRLRQ